MNAAASRAAAQEAGLVCYHYDGAVRCSAPVVGWLTAPDGTRIVAACQPHGEAAQCEYAEKLGECWTLEPCDAAAATTA